MNTLLKKILFGAVLIIAGLGIWGWFQIHQSKAVAYQFAGQLQGVNGNDLSIEGDYVYEANSKGVPEKRTATAVVDKDTKIIKVSIFLPSSQELKASGGRYNADALKREATTGSIDDLKKIAQSISVRAKGNIYGKSKFTITEVTYIIPVYPK
ncbi:hypothetical protein KW791_03535 [Candidatus Parcubacteria bacterium]|nr:hypothetical protein [Candidatus Parcubacteria bacterium]